MNEKEYKPTSSKKEKAAYATAGATALGAALVAGAGTKTVQRAIHRETRNSANQMAKAATGHAKDGYMAALSSKEVRANPKKAMDRTKKMLEKAKANKNEQLVATLEAKAKMQQHLQDKKKLHKKALGIVRSSKKAAPYLAAAAGLATAAGGIMTIRRKRKKASTEE
jgi:hypothetical protein